MRLLRAIASAFTVATVIYAIRRKRSHGTFLRVPFEFRVPTLPRIRERLWNAEEKRLLMPQVFGVGWTLNLREALDRLHSRVMERGDEVPAPSPEPDEGVPGAPEEPGEGISETAQEPEEAASDESQERQD